MAANTYRFQSAQPLGADGPALAHVLDRAGVTKTSLIRVTGPAGPTAVLWLQQHGYQHAAYVHAHWVRTMEPADVLLVPHACAPETLSDLLRGGGGLREGGALIAQVPSEQQPQGVDSLPALLGPLGYVVQTRVNDKARTVYVARRLGVGFKRAA